jgi:hypothetical protein
VNEESHRFSELLCALEPHLSHLIVVGGWAFRLYRLHENATELSFPPLMTHDADLAIPENAHRDYPDICQKLLAAGFTEEMTGSHVPPVTRYVSPQKDFEIEFITHQQGGAVKRGRSHATALLLGVSAQRLGNVRLLTMNPWTLKVHPGLGFPVPEAGLNVSVTNPASFMAQKILSFKSRAGSKKAKDILYIFDTLMLFRNSLDSIANVWGDILDQFPTELARSVQNRWHSVLVQAHLFDRAAAIASSTGRPAPPTAERLRGTCELGLSRVFGTTT